MALVPPLIASTFGQAHDLSMATPMAAAAALISGVGIESLHSRSRYWAAIAAIVTAVSAYQLLAL
jgi:hypothetical protein